ncbi:MAG: FliH/SctL family protein [Aquabacterium sp.]
MSTAEQIAALGLTLAREPAPLKPASPLTRFIPREELQEYAAWTPGAFGGPARETQPFTASRAAPPAAPDPQHQLQAARQEGYEAGYRDGMAALEAFKRSHAEQSAKSLQAVFAAARQELDALQPALAQGLAQCAQQLARGVVRSELAQRPELIAQVAADAVEALVMSARHLVLELHPQDQALVANGAAETLSARSVRLVANPAIRRGGCVLQSDAAQVDARIESRWHAAVQALGSTLPWVADPPATLDRPVPTAPAGGDTAAETP